MATNQLDNAIAALTTQVNDAVGIEASATTLIQGIPAIVAAAVAQATAAGATPLEIQSLQNLGTALTNATAPLQAALAANPDPVPAPATPPPAANP